MQRVIEDHKAELSAVFHQITDRSVVGSLFFIFVGKFPVINILSVVHGKTVISGFGDHTVAKRIPVVILQTVVVKFFAFVVEIDREMVLLLHLPEPLVGDVILTLQTGSHGDEFFLKSGISGLLDRFAGEEQTGDAECDQNCSGDNGAEKG